MAVDGYKAQNALEPAMLDSFYWYKASTSEH